MKKRKDLGAFMKRVGGALVPLSSICTGLSGRAPVRMPPAGKLG